MGSQSKLEDRIAKLEEQVSRSNLLAVPWEQGPEQRQQRQEPPEESEGDDNLIDELADILASLDLGDIDPGTMFGTPVAMPVPPPPDEEELGPEFKAWRERYKKEIGKELRAKGFTPDEVDKIIKEFIEALLGYITKGKGGMLKFIFKNLKRLKDMYDAIKKARETVGEPPPKNT